VLDDEDTFHGPESYFFSLPAGVEVLATAEKVERAGLRYQGKGLKAFFRSEEANKVTLKSLYRSGRPGETSTQVLRQSRDRCGELLKIFSE
jgi:hypothetical protein